MTLEVDVAWKISKAEVSEARRRAWQTRRAKYGQSGHDSTYSRSTVDLSTAVRDRIRLARLAAVLHGDGVLTEAQIARLGFSSSSTFRMASLQYRRGLMPRMLVIARILREFVGHPRSSATSSIVRSKTLIGAIPSIA
jgi:hypothetical protein